MQVTKAIRLLPQTFLIISSIASFGLADLAILYLESLADCPLLSVGGNS